jgi:hypothetical protein
VKSEATLLSEISRKKMKLPESLKKSDAFPEILITRLSG